MKSFLISLIILIVITAILIFGSIYLTDHCSQILSKISDLSENKEVFADENNRDKAQLLEALWSSRKKVLCHCVERQELERIDLIFSDLKCALEQENFMLYLVCKRDLEWNLNELMQKQKVDFSLIL